MANRPALFTEADVKRAIRAVQAAGLLVASVQIDKDGTIRIIPGQGEKPVDAKKKWHF